MPGRARKDGGKPVRAPRLTHLPIKDAQAAVFLTWLLHDDIP